MVFKTKDFTWLFDNYQSFFDMFEMDRENIIAVYYEWKEGPEDTVLKYLWDIFEKLLAEVYRHSSTLEIQYYLLSVILQEMRNYKIKYEGEKANDIHKKYLFCKLKHFENKWNNKQVEVKVIAGHCCPYCALANGKQVTIEEALHEQYLPEARCTNEVGCNCFYRVERLSTDSHNIN